MRDLFFVINELFSLTHSSFYGIDGWLKMKIPFMPFLWELAGMVAYVLSTGYEFEWRIEDAITKTTLFCMLKVGLVNDFVSVLV